MGVSAPAPCRLVAVDPICLLVTYRLPVAVDSTVFSRQPVSACLLLAVRPLATADLTISVRVSVAVHFAVAVCLSVEALVRHDNDPECQAGKVLWAIFLL